MTDATVDWDFDYGTTEGSDPLLPEIETLRPDGSMAASRSDATKGLELPDGIDIGTMNDGTFSVLSPRSRHADHGRTQAYSFDRVGADVAWVETHSTMLDHGDWHIYLVSEGKTTKVAGSGSSDMESWPPIRDRDTSVSLTKGYVYWNATVFHGPGGEEVEPRLFAWDRVSGKTRQVARHVSHHRAAPDGSLVYVVQQDRGRKIVVHRLGADGRDEVVWRVTMPQGWQLAGLGADTDGFAVSFSNPDKKGAKALAKVVRGERQYVLETSSSSVGALSLSGNLLGWCDSWAMRSDGDDPREFVVNLQTGKVGYVGESQGNADLAVAGDRAAWVGELGDGNEGPWRITVATLPSWLTAG